LGPVLLEFMAPEYRQACVEARGDALDGAILLARRMADEYDEQ